MKIKRRTLWVYVGAVLVYALLTVVMTWPVAAQMGTRLAGGEKDVWINPWATWWTRKALTGDVHFYWTDYLFYPQGVSLVFHSFSHTNTALALLLEPLIGTVAAQNATTLLGYALSGFSVFALVDSLFQDRSAALVAGIVFAFAPYHIDQVSHPVILSTQWIPLFLLFFLRTLDNDGLWDAVAAVLFLVLTALTSWHLFLLTVMLAGFFVLGEGISAWRHRKRWFTGSLITFILLCVILLTPLMWPQLQEWFSPASSYGKANVNEKPGKSADLLAFFVPTRQHPAWGDLTEDAQLDLLDQDHSLYLGLLATSVVLHGLIRDGKRVRRWAIIGSVFWVMSLGPYPRIGGAHLLPLPWGIPLIKIFRVSHRFHVVTTLVFAVLVGWGWSTVLQRLRRRWSKTLLVVATIGVSAAILLEYLSIPIPTSPVQISPFIRKIGENTESYAIVDLPLGRSFGRYYMFQQIFHGKRIAGGVVSRTPSRANDFLEAEPFWDKLLEDNELDSSFQDVSRHLRYLAQNNIRYMILHHKRLHRSSLPEEQLTRWRDYLTIPPLYEDDLILVYPTDPMAGRDFEIRYRLNEALGLIQASIDPTDITQGGSLFVDLRWGSQAALDEDLRVCLALLDSTGEKVQDDCWTPIPGWPTSDWPQGTIAIGKYVFQIDPHLPAGEYSLSARATDTRTGGTSGEAVTIASVTVRELPRTFTTPSMGEVVSRDFGQDLRLLGYDIATTPDVLDLTVHWQAQRRMDTSYKIFVHLYALESGELRAQEDVVPLDWTYPTTWWEKGEIVSDHISLPLSDIASGDYEVVVGVYHPETGERLPIQTKEPENKSSGSLTLQEITLP